MDIANLYLIKSDSARSNPSWAVVGVWHQRCRHRRSAFYEPVNHQHIHTHCDIENAMWTRSQCQQTKVFRRLFDFCKNFNNMCPKLIFIQNCKLFGFPSRWDGAKICWQKGKAQKKTKCVRDKKKGGKKKKGKKGKKTHREKGVMFWKINSSASMNFDIKRQVSIDASLYRTRTQQCDKIWVCL